MNKSKIVLSSRKSSSCQGVYALDQIEGRIKSSRDHQLTLEDCLKIKNDMASKSTNLLLLRPIFDQLIAHFLREQRSYALSEHTYATIWEITGSTSRLVGRLEGNFREQKQKEKRPGGQKPWVLQFIWPRVQIPVSDRAQLCDLVQRQFGTQRQVSRAYSEVWCYVRLWWLQQTISRRWRRDRTAGGIGYSRQKESAGEQGQGWKAAGRSGICKGCSCFLIWASTAAWADQAAPGIE